MRSQTVEEPAGAEFEVFVEARGAALLRVAVLLCGNDHEGQDLLQDVLVRAWPKWDRIRTGSPEAYVRQALAHAATSRWRSAWVRRRGPAHEGDTDPRVVDDGGGTVEDRLVLLAALQALPPRMRAAVVLRHYVGLGEQETAAWLGCSVGTVKSSTARALDRLRTVLAVDGEADDPALGRPT